MSSRTTRPGARQQKSTKRVKRTAEDDVKNVPEVPSAAGVDVTPVVVRRSVRQLMKMHAEGDVAPLEDLVAAFIKIVALPPTHPDSFFVVAGYHGEPFIPRTDVDKLSPTDRYAYWGGWCHHGNVLFPVWHRAYVKRLEDALSNQLGRPVAMAFWDQTSEDSRSEGLPSIFTDRTFTFSDGTTVPNPLYSYKLQQPIRDDVLGGAEPYLAYTKPAGYETVRYPKSGLVGKRDIANTQKHNANWTDDAKATKALNDNIKTWLAKGRQHPQGLKSDPPTLYDAYVECLDAPNYTVFSNTTSAAAWNELQSSSEDHVMPLESPHNSMHLCTGGFDNSTWPGVTPDTAVVFGLIAGANGDMGENNTAAFDPLFFFHHCFIDYAFWRWQVKHGAQKSLSLIDHFPGTKSIDSQGPVPDVTPDAEYTLKTPLRPFTKPGSSSEYYVGDDMCNVEDLQYTYGPGSLDNPPPLPPPALKNHSKKMLKVSGVDRSAFEGSFMVSVSATVKYDNGKEETIPVGRVPVFSRWEVAGCANCQTHLEVQDHIPLTMMTDEQIAKATFNIETTYRNIVSGRKRADNKSLLEAFAAMEKPSALKIMGPQGLKDRGITVVGYNPEVKVV